MERESELTFSGDGIAPGLQFRDSGVLSCQLCRSFQRQFIRPGSGLGIEAAGGTAIHTAQVLAGSGWVAGRFCDPSQEQGNNPGNELSTCGSKFTASDSFALNR